MSKNALSFILSLLLLTGCNTGQEKIQDEKLPIPVLTIPVEIRDVPVYIESIGILQPAVSMEIRSRVSGILEKVYVSEGDSIGQDRPLFKIDQEPYLIRVQEAKAQLAVDQANLGAVQKKLDRYKPLVQKNLVARMEWDELESEQESILALKELHRSSLKSAELDLERCTITSPIFGRIGKLDVHPGQLVDSQSRPLATICKLNPLITEFTITERELTQISPNHSVAEIRLLHSSSDGSLIPIKISFLDNQFDPKTGLLLVRGSVDNSDFSLRPGQSIQVKIPISVDLNMKLIPQKAVRYNEQGPYVYVVQSDQTVVFRQLILGSELDSQVVVLEGLDASESVITDGHLRLSPGSKVEVKS